MAGHRLKTLVLRILSAVWLMDGHSASSQAPPPVHCQAQLLVRAEERLWLQLGAEALNGIMAPLSLLRCGPVFLGPAALLVTLSSRAVLS